MFRDDKGNFSMMRLLALSSSLVGFFMCIWGTVAGNGTAMTVGGALAATANAAKAYQKKVESA